MPERVGTSINDTVKGCECAYERRDVYHCKNVDVEDAMSGRDRRFPFLLALSTALHRRCRTLEHHPRGL